MTLPELATFMRENKILVLKHEGSELTMHPAGFADAPPAPPPEIKSDDPTFATKRGKTGQTKAEQVEHFGQWFPDDFKE